MKNPMKTNCFIVSDNYSPAFAGRDVKMKMLTEEVERFFQCPEQKQTNEKRLVVVVSGSRLSSILARLQTLEKDMGISQNPQLFYVSSGSDRDPGQGTSPKELTETVRWFLERDHPVHLICWAFQTLFLRLVPVLNPLLLRENLPPVRVTDLLQLNRPSNKIKSKSKNEESKKEKSSFATTSPKRNTGNTGEGQGVLGREESGVPGSGGTFHKFLGNTVVSSHRFGVLFPFPWESWQRRRSLSATTVLWCIQEAFSTCFPGTDPVPVQKRKRRPEMDVFADLNVETYSRAGHRVLSFFSAKAGTFVGTQFHPERRRRPTRSGSDSDSDPTRSTACLVRFLRQQLLPRRFKRLLPFFLPDREMCSSLLTKQREQQEQKARTLMDSTGDPGEFRFGGESRFFRLYKFSCRGRSSTSSPPSLPVQKHSEDDTSTFLASMDRFLSASLALLHPASKRCPESEEGVREKKFFFQVQSRFQNRFSIFYYPSPSVRKPLTANMSRWLRTQEFNGGFQPTDVPAIFLFRKEGVQEVARHEICHFLVDSGYLPELVSAAKTVQRRLETIDLLCRGTGSVLRAEEGFIELLSNCLSFEEVSSADASGAQQRTRVLLSNLLGFLLRQCSYLQQAENWQRWQCLVQKSCIFSYFFLRTALLLDLLLSSSTSPTSRRPEKSTAVSLLSRFRELLQDGSRVRRAAGRAVQLLVSPSFLHEIKILSEQKWEPRKEKEAEETEETEETEEAETGVMTPNMDSLSRPQRVFFLFDELRVLKDQVLKTT